MLRSENGNACQYSSIELEHLKSNEILNCLEVSKLGLRGHDYATIPFPGESKANAILEL